MTYLEYFNFCPRCDEYSGISFNILDYGDSPPDSELLECECGWIGSWEDCTERRKRWRTAQFVMKPCG